MAVIWPNTPVLHAIDEPLFRVLQGLIKVASRIFLAIGGATGATYTLTDDGEGKAIKVLVTFTDDAEHEEAITSDATKVVGMA